MTRAHEPPGGAPPVRIEPITPPRRLREEPDEPEPAAQEQPFDPFRELLGAVVMVPNEHWGFSGVTSDQHPGACTHVATARTGGTLVKGTDANHPRAQRGHLVVDPTPENGLDKPTAFELVPRVFRMHRLRLYFPERLRGKLSGAALAELRAELARLHPEG